MGEGWLYLAVILDLCSMSKERRIRAAHRQWRVCLGGPVFSALQRLPRLPTAVSNRQLVWEPGLLA